MTVENNAAVVAQHFPTNWQICWSRGGRGRRGDSVVACQQAAHLAHLAHAFLQRVPNTAKAKSYK
jgi:hypothetical protein